MNSSNIKTTIIIQSPPFGRIDGKEGVDLALVYAAFEFRVDLVFIDEGIFHLIEKQDETTFSDKLHDKQLKALEFYEIEKIYVEKESLDRFDIDYAILIDNTHILAREQINTKVSNNTNTVIF